MLIIPAIDLKDGRCVRLRQGRADEVKVYSADPVQTARQWAARGAHYLHVVDLDGAFQGRPAHAALIASIAGAVAIPVEVGGGLRTDAAIAAALDGGAARVIVGTRAVAEPATLKDLIARFGPRLAVGIDARDGLVQVKGWVETTGTNAAELAAAVDALGAATIIYTDTATDGMLRGPNLAGVRAICGAVKCHVIASGGISSAADIRALRALDQANLAGAIVGKALYEGAVELGELMAAAGG
jgi:phosphoribosylformimino-5-aminoimidazole carboxamide ribotide isomerase